MSNYPLGKTPFSSFFHHISPFSYNRYHIISIYRPIVCIVYCFVSIVSYRLFRICYCFLSISIISCLLFNVYTYDYCFVIFVYGNILVIWENGKISPPSLLFYPNIWVYPPLFSRIFWKILFSPTFLLKYFGK